MNSTRPSVTCTNHLGMQFDFSKPGEVAVLMHLHVQDATDAWPEELKGKASTPAASHFHKINEHWKKLEEEKSKIFHTIMAKCLWIMKWARPDVQTAMSFLTTRVQSPDEDDWKKSRRVILCLKNTQSMKLALSADGTNVMNWWADGSFVVLPDCKSQTGGTMAMGKGSVWSTSIKQKLNTTSSTETELVAAHNVMGPSMWTKHFMKWQGHRIKNLLH